MLGRLGEFALPGPLAEVEGVVEFRVDVPRGRPEVHVLVFDGAGVAVAPAGTRRPDVTIALAAADFVRMVSGGRNAALLLLGDRLRVEGDEQLALRVGGVFRVPGRPGVAVDPSAVDPEQAAVVLAGVKDRHLERLMSGGFREVVLDQVFRRLPDFLDEQRAGDATLTVAFRIDAARTAAATASPCTSTGAAAARSGTRTATGTRRSCSAVPSSSSSSPAT